MDNDIIYVLESKWMDNKEYNKTHLSNEAIVNTINKKWLLDISWEEFYDLFWFKFQDWYTNKLSEKGLTYYSINWNEFINEKIGDLEAWIQENKPKK